MKEVNRYQTKYSIFLRMRNSFCVKLHLANFHLAYRAMFKVKINKK